MTDSNYLSLVAEVKRHIGEGLIYFPMYARNGIYKAGKAVISKYSTKNIALIPSYSCGDEVFALRCAGFNTIDYGIDADLQFDIKDIEEKISDKVGLVLVTRYFGVQNNNLAELITLSQKEGFLIMEDCAHFWPLGNGSMHSNADFSIYSLRKVFNIPNGGVIQVNNARFTDLTIFKSPSDEVVNLSQYIYYGQKVGAFPKGMTIREIYDSLGIKITNIHGARFEEEGGYELGLADQLIPFVLGELERIDKYTNAFSKYYDLMSNIKNRVMELCFEAYTNQHCLPANILFRVEDVGGFEAEIKNLEVKNVQRFWTFMHEYVDWGKYKVVSDFKKHNFIIDYRQSLEEHKIAELSRAIKKYS